MPKTITITFVFRIIIKISVGMRKSFSEFEILSLVGKNNINLYYYVENAFVFGAHIPIKGENVGQDPGMGLASMLI